MTDVKIDSKFNDLLARGEDVLRRHRYSGTHYEENHPPDDEYQQYRIEAQNLIVKVCGNTSPHAVAMDMISKNETTRLNSFYFKDVYGILKAAYQDYKDGFLVEIKRLVRADLLDDFLSQAEMLVEQGYYVAAASLAGAVLEDTLRKLCDIHSIAYPDKTKIDGLNIDLAKADVYDKLLQKEITAKADLRNKADHGQFKEVREDDVQYMVQWIRRFVTERLR